MSLLGALKQARELLGGSATNGMGSSSSSGRGLATDVELEVLVAAAFREVTGRPLARSELYLRGSEAPPVGMLETLTRLCADFGRGTPLQHVTGVQQFLEHEYRVGPEVLIPRPETEVLVRLALEVLRQESAPSLGLEIGLGSGILSIELLAAFPSLQVHASELSEAAALLAERNAHAILGAADVRLTILRAHSADEIWPPFERAAVEAPLLADFLISNPPYLLPGEATDAVARTEPAIALWAPAADPLYFYRGVAERVREFLRVGGHVFLELPPERAEPIARLFSLREWDVRLERDLNEQTRVLCARRKN